MRWPLRYQIMIPMAVTMLLTVGAVGGVGALLALREAEARIAAQIDEVAGILSESNFPLTNHVLRQLRALSSAELVAVDGAGRIVAASGSIQSFASGLVDDNSSPKSFLLGDRRWTRQNGYFHTVVDLKELGRDGPSESLHILYPEDEYRRAWQRAVYPPIVFMALALPVVILLAAITSNQIGSRVGRLQRQVERIAAGNFDQVSTTDRDDEIEALAKAVNRMAAMLVAYHKEIRDTEQMRALAILGSGIAHQLRNSATGCALAIDLHVEECPLASACDSLEVAKRQLRLMEEYLQQFLQLGRQPDGDCDEVAELGELVGELIPLVEPAARHAGVELNWSPAAVPIAIVCNRQMLNQLVINLLLNAVEAAAQEKVRTGHPGRVAIMLEQVAQNRALLSVCDSGPGPNEGIQLRLFEPFVSNRPDGVGIGLSVAREVALHHGGGISWQRVDDTTRFIVELPCNLNEMEHHNAYHASS